MIKTIHLSEKMESQKNLESNGPVPALICAYALTSAVVKLCQKGSSITITTVMKK